MVSEANMAEPLQKELETYKRNLPALLRDEGKFALIFGDDILGIFGTYEDALNAGYEKAKLAPFLVKKISGAETIAYFTRDISACLISPS
jgi:hypothetical protein